MSNTNYFEATIDLLRWEQSESWRRILSHPNTNDWRYDTHILRRYAFNLQFKNIIGITGPEVHIGSTFNSKVPSSVAFGGLGMVLAHELIHSLDNKGLKVDENGDIHDWVDNRTIQNFQRRTKCFVKQYSKFKDTKFTQLTVDGGKTQDEILSDNGGLKVAYGAYRRATKRPEPRLPGLAGFTPDQLFFITAANYYCEIPDKNRYAHLIQKDSHPPNEFRVKGMMMNSREFSRAFCCRKWDAMNPPDKCEVW